MVLFWRPGMVTLDSVIYQIMYAATKVRSRSLD